MKTPSRKHKGAAMIIECENCHAKFRLDDSKIPEQGRKVKCSKCQHIFLARRTSAPPRQAAAPRPAPPVRTAAPPPPPPPPPPPAPPPEEAGLDIGLNEEELARMEAGEPEGRRRAQPEETFEPTVRIDLSAQEQLAFEEEEVKPTPPPAPRRKAVGRPLILGGAVVLFLAIVAAALYYLDLLPLPSAAPESPVANLVIDQGKLEGKWEKNAQIPRIFIINGTVENRSKRPRAFIKVQGVLLDRDRKTLKEALAFCGNPIPAQELRTKAPAEIQNSMKNRNGKNGMNQKIAPGASIPFTVVFFDVPEGVESFGAVVTEAVIPES